MRYTLYVLQKRGLEIQRPHSTSNACGTTALLTVTINANYLLASGGNGATLPIKQYIDRNGKLLNESNGLARFLEPLEQLDTMQILLKYHAELDDNNKFLDIPAPEPVIRVRRRFTHTSEAQQEEMQILATIIREAFSNQPVTQPAPTPAPRMELLGFGVFSHEVGTMRMPSPSNDCSVVDSNLQVNGFQNLFVCDLSVFPVSTEANPTLTLAALSMRLSSFLTLPQMVPCVKCISRLSREKKYA
ncbi:GMC oxidoreductase-domain-containing protein [Tirmania nivea]|nr:GMC oxidoreductase-domain-containing protein [Tirmania nivea]